jgi:hypothetical protein
MDGRETVKYRALYQFKENTVDQLIYLYYNWCLVWLIPDTDIYQRSN